MPEFLGDGQPINTQDNYVPALTLGPAARVAQITLSVLGQNPALIQCWRYLDKEKTKPQIELVQRTIVGQSIGVVLRNCAGVQIRSATVGVPTTVVGELAYEDDISLEGGGVTSAVISTAGKTSSVSAIPSGTILPFAGQTPPVGFVLCDGSTYDGTNASYANLWAVIGTLYGGSGQSAFKVPDLRGRVIVGEAPGGKADVNALGNNEGLGETLRNISHHHTTSIKAGTPNGQPGGGWDSGGVTSGDADNIDKPAYLVVNYVIAL